MQWHFFLTHERIEDRLALYFGNLVCNIYPVEACNGGRAAPNEVSLRHVWRPPHNIDFLAICNGESAQRNCFNQAMLDHGAPTEAVQFANDLKKIGFSDAYMYSFKEAGHVDLAAISIYGPLSDGGTYLFVNGTPPLMSAIDLIGYDRLDIESKNLIQKLGAGRKPRIWSIIGFVGSSLSRSHDDGLERERITLRWDVRDGCRGCEILGTIDSTYIFVKGTYRGYEFHNFAKR